MNDNRNMLLAIVLSALVRLPQAALVAIAGVILIGHNALDGIRVPFWTPGSNVPVPGLAEASWMLLHQFGLFPVGGASGPIVIAQYPLLPWIGILTAGYVMAAIYTWPAEQRRRALTLAAMAMLALFLVLRTWNIYGDTTDWAPQPTSARQRPLQPSQLVVLSSSHSSPGSRRPLPHSASARGSSTFTNLPRPRSFGPGGSFDVHVHGLLSGSNSISRVKLARVGSGNAVNRCVCGSKRTSVSEFEPLIHTWPVGRFT